ncbi:twin-arginine translocase TatA/TatE family subunit [Aquipseudomonas alcaligenes]|uniref:Sec-independent protein translocase protein TatA n=1 Tax=Aquipseudomonas alcaligenes TaxID=43263 RepID=A0A1N6P583_AQUAC|nr:twin-arginine translocase TatA/TatE family subunit [Pseudomonas alcaligenes]SIP99551.1 sec-independent protein translocase protein TatA [Pseudomonas alcaligenes]
MGIFDWKHWLVILIVVVLVFGTKRLKNLGSDLGETIKGFRKAMNSDEEKPAEASPQAPVQATPSTTTEAPHKPQTIDAQAQRVEDPVRKD